MADNAPPDISGGLGSGSSGVTSPYEFKFEGLDTAAQQIANLNTQLGELSKTLTGMTANKGGHTGGLSAISAAVQSVGKGTSIGYNPLAANYQSSPRGGDSEWMASSGSSGVLGFLGSLTALPLQYGFNRVEENRAITRNMSYDLSRESTLSGTGIQSIIRMLSEQVPIQGTPEDITAAMDIGARTGNANLNSPRAGAYYTSMRQMQQFTPSVRAPDLAQMMNRTLGNTRAQQTSMMLTGGAMSSFGPGAVPKTLQEWAESILRWFEGQRPGADRGKGFTKEELMSQMFPGSNMNAWFSSTGVEDYMIDYFWQYAIGKMQSGVAVDSKTGGVTMEQIIGQRKGDLGLATRATETASARRDFTLAATPSLIGGDSFYDAYMKRESTDRTWTNWMSQVVDKGISKVLGGIAQLFAYIPTPLARGFAQTITNLPGNVGSMLDNAMSAASAAKGAGDVPIGDIGDVGGYGPMGATNTAGMTPSMANRVGAMMQANPNLRITSGFRDGSTQQRLHSKGVGRVAPQGRSMHGRGLAADLGPPSQFGWIARNANKFGLSSGVGHGEPWHVGFPGTVPHKYGDVPIGDLSDLIGGVESTLNPANWWDGIKGGVSNVLSGGGLGGTIMAGISSMLGGDFSALFGGGSPFDPKEAMVNTMSGIYNLMGIPQALNPLALAAGTAGKGLSAKDFSAMFASLLTSGTGGLIAPNLSSSTDWASGSAGSILGGAVGGAVGGGTASGTPGTSGGVAAILQKWNAGNTSVAAASVAGHEQAIKDALSAAQKAGFSGDALIAIAAIAGRESTWTPSSHRSTSNLALNIGDRGEWQINSSHDASLAAAGIIPSNTPEGRAALYDINTNAKAAYSFTGGGSNLKDWNMGPGGWGTGPPLYKAAQYVEPVYNIAKQNHFIGDPEFEGGGYGAPGGTTRIAVHNSITVNASGSSPANLRQTAAQLGRFTTEEIRKQLARST